MMRLILSGEQRMAVTRLSGYRGGRGRFQPSDSAHAADALVAELAQAELEGDLETTYGAIKSAFALRRRDVGCQGPIDGGGVITTPLFEYRVSASADANDHGIAVFRRELAPLVAPESLSASALAAAFADSLTTIELQAPHDAHAASIEDLIDRAEDLAHPGITIEHDRRCTWCRLLAVGEQLLV
ncbi:MAG: hypothetical protein ACYTF0_02510, partial [Planctomycetota bacterium]